MTTAWSTLMRLRERQKATANEHLASARAGADRAVADSERAGQAVAGCIADRRALWRDTLDRRAQGGLGPDQLRLATQYDRVVSRQLTDARQEAEAALARQRQAQAAMEAARQELRRRCAALEKAERVTQRQAAEERRRGERRAEDESDAAALAAWWCRTGVRVP